MERVPCLVYVCIHSDPPFDEAGTFGASGAVPADNMMMPAMPSPPPDYDTLTMKKKKERKTSIFQPAYFGLVRVNNRRTF